MGARFMILLIPFIEFSNNSILSVLFYYYLLFLFTALALPPSLIAGVLALYFRSRAIVPESTGGPPCTRNGVLVLLANSSPSAFQRDLNEGN